MGERRRVKSIEWQVIKLRSRREYIGTVTAPAIKVALEAFALDTAEASRLLVRRIVRSRA